METRRPPLKRLCPDLVNKSPRKRRFASLQDEKENGGPEVSCSDSWSSLLRVTEQEIKPDTPAIPSIRSRIRMLRDLSVTDTAPNAGQDLDGVPPTERDKNGCVLADPVPEEEPVTDTVYWDLNSGNKTVIEEGLVPVAHSTLATRCPLLSTGVNLPSEETASRLRKERQEELAMISTVVDHGNPWRAESMRRRPKRVEEQASVDLTREKRRRRVRTGRGQVKMGPLLETHSDSSGSESIELFSEGRDGSIDAPDNHYVSSLEVQLRGTCNSGLSSECMGEDTSQGTMDSSALIDRLFEAALDAGDGSAARDSGDGSAARDSGDGSAARDSGDCSAALDAGDCSAARDSGDCSAALDAGDGSAALDAGDASDELEMDLPPMSILSPLTKSADIQAAFSPLNSVVSSLPELWADPLVTPKTSTDEPDHLHYSIDRYRTLRRNVLTEGNAKVCPPSQIHHSAGLQAARGGADLKERIMLLSKEVSSLQRIIEQACTALSCCVDAEHGKGSRQEAEAERLLLLSTEKKGALLKELEQLRGQRSEDPESSPNRELRPCHATVSISDIQLPLKVDYVCSTLRESGPAGHYFLILIRLGSHDVVATPLASTVDAQTGDTILYPTAVTLNDAASDFRIEIEVYSLARGGSDSSLDKRKSLKPKMTPKKLLSSRKSSLNSPAYSPAVSSSLRSSSFLLVGSLSLSLESLGKFRFPLEKVPFLCPLEGSLYLTLQCQSHSSVQRRGFLTMFEDVGGLGAWHRRWCVLAGNSLSLWAYPDQETCKEPLARINLVNCTSAKIETAKRETCARAHTLELITMRPQREDDLDTLVTQCRNTMCFTKFWLSADTRDEKDLWVDCLNQVLLDLRTWRTSPGKVTPSQPAPK